MNWSDCDPQRTRSYLWLPDYGAKFHQNWVRIATVDVTDSQTDAGGFIICPMLCYRNRKGTDKKTLGKTLKTHFYEKMEKKRLLTFITSMERTDQQTVVRSRQLSKWWCWSWNRSPSLNASSSSALPASSANSRCWAFILLCINALHDRVFTVWIRAKRAFCSTHPAKHSI